MAFVAQKRFCAMMALPWQWISLRDHSNPLSKSWENRKFARTIAKYRIWIIQMRLTHPRSLEEVWVCTKWRRSKSVVLQKQSREEFSEVLLEQTLEWRKKRVFFRGKPAPPRKKRVSGKQNKKSKNQKKIKRNCKLLSLGCWKRKKRVKKGRV